MAGSAPGWSAIPADIDVHMVSHPARRPGHRAGAAARATWAGPGSRWASPSPVLLPALLQLLLALLNPEQNVATAMLVQLTGSVAVALVGGLWPAILAALWSSLLVNYFSTPPLGNLTISDPQNFLRPAGVRRRVGRRRRRGRPLRAPLQGGRPGPGRGHHAG